MNQENPFKGLKETRIELSPKLKIDGMTLTIIPEVEDAELFMTLRGENLEEEGKRMTKIIINMLKRSYPAAEEDETKRFVSLNYPTLMGEIAIIYGFTTRDKIEEIKKKAIEQPKKEI